MSKDTGGPAFPQAEDESGWEGMTLRDYFAAKAMQSILLGLMNHKFDIQYDEIASMAYGQADAMIEARKQ